METGAAMGWHVEVPTAHTRPHRGHRNIRPRHRPTVGPLCYAVALQPAPRPRTRAAPALLLAGRPHPMYSSARRPRPRLDRRDRPPVGRGDDSTAPSAAPPMGRASPSHIGAAPVALAHWYESVRPKDGSGVRVRPPASTCPLHAAWTALAAQLRAASPCRIMSTISRAHVVGVSSADVLAGRDASAP